MIHKAKIDWWIAVALILGVAAPFAGARLWITIPLFLGVGICGYPQHYETATEGLVIRAGLTRRMIPYEAITFVGPRTTSGAGFAVSLDRVSVRCGPNAGVLISPADYLAFLADMARRTPHLTRRGQDLVPAHGQPWTQDLGIT